VFARWRGGYTDNGGGIWASLKPAEVQAAPLREAKYTVGGRGAGEETKQRESRRRRLKQKSSRRFEQK